MNVSGNVLKMLEGMFESLSVRMFEEKFVRISEGMLECLREC